MTVRVQHILRWLAVLPAALLASALVTIPVDFIFGIIYSIIYGPSPGDSPGEATALYLYRDVLHILESLPEAFFIGLAFVCIGALIAPTFRFRVAVGLAALLETLYLALGNPGGGETWLGFNVLGATAGIGLIWLWYRKARTQSPPSAANL